MSEDVLSANHVFKSYNRNVVLEDLSFTMRHGTCSFLFGRNGSGKTTFLRVLSSLIPADAGTVTLHGRQVGLRNPELRRELFYLDVDVFPTLNLTGWEVLLMTATLWGVPNRTAQTRVREFLHFADLERSANEIVGGYSVGMRRQLGIGCGLIVDAPLLVLDEPLEGLDPAARTRYLKVFARYVRQRRRAILASSHDPSVLDADVSFRSLVMRDGKIFEERPSFEAANPGDRANPSDEGLSWL